MNTLNDSLTLSDDDINMLRSTDGRFDDALDATPESPMRRDATPITLDTDDGARISAQLFAPDAPPRGVVLIAGGTAIPQRFYGRFAAHLAAHGYAALTLDYRGIGASSNAHPSPSYDGWVRDLDAAVRHLTDRWPGVPFHYLGHSFGGQVMGLVPSAHARVTSVLLVAAGAGWVGHWPVPQRLALTAMFRAVVPASLAVFGRVPGWMGLGHDLPAGVAREWARWCTTPGYLSAVVPERARFYGSVRVPMLAWSFTDDTYGPAGAVNELLSWYAATTIEHRCINPAARGGAPIGHFGFFREPMADTLWRDAVAWLDAHTQQN